MRITLAIIGYALIAIAIFVVPVSFLAGNPAILGAGFAGLIGGTLVLGLSRIIALLERIADNIR